MTWAEVSQSNLSSARRLYEARYWRSSVSRSYYALFAAVTSAVPARALPPRYTAPRHRDLPGLIDRHLVRLAWHQREAMKAAWRRCYGSRLMADYNVGRDVDQPQAKQAIQDAIGIMRRMGVSYA